jgi:hypothetical protein
LFSRRYAARRWREISVYLAAAFIALLPLIVYFVVHPTAFWVRIGQVAPGSSVETLSLSESLLKSWGMLFLQGDPFWRFNIPGRPLFGWIAGALLVVGWIVIIIRWRRFPYDWQRSALTVLIFTPLVMILPTALATNEIVPSNLRAIGLIPFIFFLPAIGVVVLLHDIERRFSRPPVTSAVLFISLLVLLSGGVATSGAYFEEWAQDKDLFYEADGDLAAVSHFLDETDLEQKTVYIAAEHYRHPTVAFLSDAYEQVKWLPGAGALVFPPTGDALVIYPHSSPAPDWAQFYLEEGQKIEAQNIEVPDDAFVAYHLPETAVPSIPDPLAVNFGNAISLLGYEVSPGEADSDLEVILSWQVQDPPSTVFMPFLQLEDRWGHRWSQVESFSYPSEQWASGETIVQQVRIPIPAGTPPGEYRLRLGLFDPTDNNRLPRLDAEGRYAGDSYFIENIEIFTGEIPEELPEPPFFVDELVQPGLRLLGYERGAAVAQTGAPWEMALWWLANEPLPAQTSWLELVNDDGTSWTISNDQPVHGTYPFSDWDTPQFVIARQSTTIPLELPAGEYWLRLRIMDDSGNVRYSVDLGSIAIVETEREFVLPPLAQEVGAIFGSEILLAGYDLQSIGDGRMQLRVVWQAIEQPMDDYTVFVHLLNKDGTCCVWQQDVMPQQNTYPTGQWLAGEVVEDTYKMELPNDLLPGEYAIEVGLYLAETGKRLRVEQPGADESDKVMLPALQVP